MYKNFLIYFSGVAAFLANLYVALYFLFTLFFCIDMFKDRIYFINFLSALRQIIGFLPRRYLGILLFSAPPRNSRRTDPKIAVGQRHSDNIDWFFRGLLETVHLLRPLSAPSRAFTWEMSD